MTVTLGKRTITLAWPVATTIVLAIAGGCIKGTLFVDQIMQTQVSMERKLDAIIRRDTAYDKKTDENTADIILLKPSINILNKRITGLEESLPVRKRVKYYTEIKRADGIEFRPYP
jgi:hypothetical protein